MNNKYIIIILIIFCISCNNRQDRQQDIISRPTIVQTPTYGINTSFNKATVTCSDPHIINKVSIKCLDSTIAHKFKGRYTFDINAHLRNNRANRLGTAYMLSCNDCIEGTIHVNDSIKFKIQYKYTPQERENYYANINSQYIAPLSKDGSQVPPKSDVRRWLYNNGKHLTDDNIDKMYDIYSDLCLYKSNIYTIPKTTKIPVLKSFAGIRYRIQTNIISDYYYLFATDDVHDLHIFIEDMIANDFINAENSCHRPLSCFKSKGKSGILILFLICINRDWTKTVLPIGVTCIDNSPPIIMSENLISHTFGNDMMSKTVENIEKLNNRNTNFNQGNPQHLNTPKFQQDIYLYSSEFDFNVRINIPPFDWNYPGHIGYLTIRTGSFVGNQANFNLNFSGDVSSVAIRYEDTVNKVNLEGKKSPYTYNCWLPLNIGDNYVTISAQDKLGNVSESLHKIVMVRIKDETPDINIDIDIDNDVTIF